MSDKKWLALISNCLVVPLLHVLTVGSLHLPLSLLLIVCIVDSVNELALRVHGEINILHIVQHVVVSCNYYFPHKLLSDLLLDHIIEITAIMRSCLRSIFVFR